MPTAIIWGADGGIGRSCTKLLTDKGWDVVALARHTDQVDDSAMAVVEIDNVANPVAAEQAIYRVQMEIDEADMLIYAVGDITQAAADDMDSGAWQRIIDANLTGAFMAYKSTLPLLTPAAPIFFLGAVSERLHLPKLSAYVAAKAGLEAFVATIRKEQRKRPITIVRPGAVDTEFWEKVSLRKPKDAADPDKIAQKIWAAFEEKSSGTLDITH